jgi:hypothetical protein
MTVAWLSAACALPASGQQVRHPRNDYPTAARVDFVIGCLMDHQFKHDALEPCSCKIDVIADQLTYDEYDEADTILGVQRNGGMGRANDLFRDTPVAHKIMGKFHQAQAEAEKECKLGG